MEGAKVNESEYVVVGNEDEGYLLQVKNIYNDTDSSTDDEVIFEDVFSGDTYNAVISSTEGSGTVTIGGKQYDITYIADKVNQEDDAFYVQLDYPDSTTANYAVMYPTIQTSKGAKLAFYEPLEINLSDWKLTWTADSASLAGLQFPDGKSYETAVTFKVDDTGYADAFNVSVGGAADLIINMSAFNSTTVAIADGTTTALTYNITTTGECNMTKVYLLEMDGAGNMERPGIIIFEEEDDNNDRLALYVEMEGDGTDNDEVGVEDVEFAWEHRTISDYEQLESDSDLYEYVDLWGTFVTMDKGTSSQYWVTISYPDEQVHAQIYAAEAGASITPGTTTSGTVSELGSITVKDSEISQVSGKNLIVVGGSCVNTVASKLLNNAACAASFTAEAGVGADQFLVKVLDSPYTTGKVAMLVAGYEAADTTKAIKYLTTEVVDTTVGTDLKKVTATYADVA